MDQLILRDHPLSILNMLQVGHIDLLCIFVINLFFSYLQVILRIYKYLIF